ncbi:hypothetical protein [Pedobacter sp. Leaf250]|uniref:hypothetical protein n=1 Tax=Pedobacter sp. Leaf250 TaxID=2876559 RepID=UPI001E2B9B10|nr:hypothetical protein [Pedobacter sp. Leaf250]
MERNQVVEISKLSAGDIFYKVGGDKNKTFAFINAGATLNNFIVCPSEFYNNRFQNQRSEKITEDIKVVFLRSIK